MIDAALALVPRWLLLVIAGACLTMWGVRGLELADARSKLADSRETIAALKLSIKDGEVQAARVSTANLETLLKAQNDAKKREDALRAAAAGARAESDGLRNDAADLRGQLESLTREAAIDRASAIAGVLGQCSTRYQVLAERCDRHVNDLRTLTDAWPKN